MDFQETIDNRIEDILTDKKLEFNILFVSDGNSRLSPLRGALAMDYFKTMYSTLADISVTTMTSNGFLREEPDLHKYNVLWIDNVTNPKFIHDLSNLVLDYEAEICGGKIEIDGDVDTVDQEKVNKELQQRRDLRMLSLRVIYALDEFIWDAPAGRQVNMFTARMVEDALLIADEIVVPNTQMYSILKEAKLVAEDKDIVVINTFVNDAIYPLHKMFERSSHYATAIRRPKILIKGTTIPQNVQKFMLLDGITKSYKITISSVGNLCPELYNKLRQTPDGSEPEITTIPHWAVPTMEIHNYASKLATERDIGFDFVITTVPSDIANNPYELTNADTDNIIAVAEGAVTLAGVKGSPFTSADHICVATSMTFSPADPPEAIVNLIERWRICANWDAAYKKQRELLAQKTISSDQILGGFFHAMLGRRLSDAYFNKVKDALEKERAKAKGSK